MLQALVAVCANSCTSATAIEAQLHDYIGRLTLQDFSLHIYLSVPLYGSFTGTLVDMKY